MKKKDRKNIINLILFILGTIGLVYFLIFILPFKNETNKEYCRFGNITLDMDSVKAVHYMDAHRLKFSQRTETDIPLECKGDSVGYTCRIYNKEYESFYIKLKNKKVYKILFKSNYIKENDILIVHEGKKMKLTNKPFEYVGKDFTFKFDGKNKYIVTKNY